MKKFNIYLAGHSNSKKQEFVEAKTNQKFQGSIQTVGFDSVLEEYKGCKFTIFDTPEQERYSSLSVDSVKRADGILIVFSVYDKDTFNNLISEWINRLGDTIDLKRFPVVLVGIKDDDQKEKAIKNEEVENLGIVKDNNIPYFEATINSADAELVLTKLYDTIIEKKLK